MLAMWTKQFCLRLMAVLLVGSFVAGPMLYAGQSDSQSDSKKSESSRRGRKYTPPPPTSHVEVTVIRATNGKPIPNAGVVFHLQGEKGNMELKSDYEGKAAIDVLPIGSKIRLQVIAKGFQTYGQDYDIDAKEKSIEVRMERPQRQYSIYEKHDDDTKTPDGSKDQSTPEPSKSTDAPKQDTKPQ